MRSLKKLRLLPLIAVLFVGLTATACDTSATADIAPQGPRDLSIVSPESVGMSSERLERLSAGMQKIIDDGRLAGITTMIGGSLGPITVGIDCGGSWNVGKMLQAAEQWPINFGFLGRGNSSKPRSLLDQISGGCLGLKIHEDWGAMPAVIDCCLSVADDLDFQVQLHTDTLNESGFLEDTLEAINGRTIHMYHTEGAGGGHAPDDRQSVV